jgi:hypothetical protein
MPFYCSKLKRNRVRKNLTYIYFPDTFIAKDTRQCKTPFVAFLSDRLGSGKIFCLSLKSFLGCDNSKGLKIRSEEKPRHEQKQDTILGDVLSDVIRFLSFM